MICIEWKRSRPRRGLREGGLLTDNFHGKHGAKRGRVGDGRKRLSKSRKKKCNANKRNEERYEIDTRRTQESVREGRNRTFL